MKSFLSLSLSLFALPACAAIAAPATSHNDPFRAVVLVQRIRQPEPPLCCLKPLPTVDPPEGPEDVLLSFTEWKSRHGAQPARPDRHSSDSTAPSAHTPVQLHPEDVDVSPPADLADDAALPPYFRVPITDRFNYASLDCSARIHTTHKSAKSASSILSSKKDKYMLSPCGSPDQFVVVELCDDIRIDTVQLANFEFFSGVFRDFEVSVAKTYTGTDEGWTSAGTYRAKNVRGVQSFHPPTSLHDFYRYIRIDFRSHYGHEYYCPVSLLRVYGLTHLEEWKWDTWLAESRTRTKEPASGDLRLVSGDGNATHLNQESNGKGVPDGDADVSMARASESRGDAVQEPLLEPPKQEPFSRGSPSAPSPSQSRRRSDDSAGTIPPVRVEQHALSDLPSSSSGIRSVAEAISSLLPPSSPGVVMSPTTDYAHAHPPVHESDNPVTSPSSQWHQIHTNGPSQTVPVQVQQTPTHAVSGAQWSGESIYRTIMNRLTVLEANHSLYAQYVEEQTAGVREVLTRLTEEVGRLESVSRMQAQTYQRTVREWERQRLRLEYEHGELLSRVNYLEEEVVLEKRLGIAQLCLLLAVLVFMGLTRGAPSSVPAHQVASRSMRGWGEVRNLSFGSSTEGWRGLGRSRSPAEERVVGAGVGERVEKATGAAAATDVPTTIDGTRSQSRSQRRASSGKPKGLKVMTAFAPADTGTLALSPSPQRRTYVRAHVRADTHPHPHPHASSSAFRTPTKSRPSAFVVGQPHTLPRTAESSVLTMTRSQSSSGSGPAAYVHGSGHGRLGLARRWRTAHLHEIKGRERERRGACRDEEDKENECGGLGDVFYVGRSKRNGRAEDDNSTDADTDVWLDTDVEEEGERESERAVVVGAPPPGPPERGVFGTLASTSLV